MNVAHVKSEGPFGYLNGEYNLLDQMYVSVLDRGFIYGDGCYEVIPVYQKKPFLLSKHLDRLFQNLDKIQLQLVEDKSKLTDILNKLLEMSSSEFEYIYLQVTRGAYNKREHIFPKNVVPTIFAYVFPFVPPNLAQASKGIQAITQDDLRWKRCDIKSISLLGNVLLREMANAQNAEETILLKDGFVTEGSISNVFIVKSGKVMTPPLSNAILPGITRATVIEILKNQNIPFEESSIKEADLRMADEIWVTSSTREVVPISSLDSKKLEGPLYNKIWEKIFTAYQEVKTLV